MSTTPELVPHDRQITMSAARFVTVTPEPALAVDAEGRVLAASAAFARTFGHLPGTLRGHRLSELVHPDDAATMTRCLARVRRSPAPLDLQHRLRTADGEYRRVDSVLVGMARAGEVAVIARDVTDQFESLDALNDRIGAWEQVMDVLREGIVVIDASGVVVAANTAAARFLAVEQNDLAGSLARAQVVVIDEDGHPMRKERLPSSRAFATGVPQEEPVAYRRRDESVVWLYARAIPLRRPGEIEPSRVAIVLEDAITSPVAPPVGPPGPTCGLLTPRERDVLRALADGLDVRAIAARLEISVHTTRGHVKRIMQKLDARTQLQAVLIGVRLGLVEVR
jgi:PAS domain S-box-containing protein